MLLNASTLFLGDTPGFLALDLPCSVLADSITIISMVMTELSGDSMGPGC